MANIHTLFTNIMEEAPHEDLLRLQDYLRDQGIAAFDLFAAEIDSYFVCLKCKDTRKVQSGQFDNHHDVPCECTVDSPTEEDEE